MANINLLPWREERREELKKEFLTVLGGIVVFALLIVFLWHSKLESSIQNQQARNGYLKKNIAELSLQVAEIQELKKKREQLIERMRIIQELQGNRPEIVHIIDELVRTIPDGVYYKNIDRKDKVITINGTAESNNRVSSLMRRLDNSEWFGDPNLISVKTNPQYGEQANDFLMKVKLEKPVSINTEKSD